MPAVLAKPALRKLIWDALVSAGADRPPGAHGRIPNHALAAEAAARLVEHPTFHAARVLKCNPDTPHRHVRAAALAAGKVVFLAVPRLATARPFLRLDGAALGPERAWEAAGKAGAARLGVPTAVADVPRIDLVIAGCVGVAPNGDRLGKGGGYSDIEWGLLTETGALDPETLVATTIHPLQLVDAVPMDDHDVSFDLVALPDRVVETGRTRVRPRGIDWSRLSGEKRGAIPALAAD